MVVVPTDKIKSGQILAKEVRDINGRLLLSSGNKLEANHIRIFKIWGVPEVSLVAADHHDDSHEPDRETVFAGQKEESLKALFRHVDLMHPAVKEIYKLAALFRDKHNIKEEDRNLPTGDPGIQQRDPTRDFIKKINTKNIVLPEIPAVAFELKEVIDNPMSSAEHIARVVSTSPSLTAVLLRIVNSSFYGFPSRISTVSHAVSLIGTREISGLALGISILSIFKKIPPKTIDMYSFLRHSLACGILSRVLSAHINMPQTEQMFVSGLLHDLGRLMLYYYFPDESLYILARSRKSDNLLYHEEKNYLECDHTQVGRHLMKQWKLPLTLEDNVLHHHRPSKAEKTVPATIVHLADIIVNSLGIGSSGETFVPPLDYDAWEKLELSPSSFETIIGLALHQFQGLESILHA